MDPFTIGSLVVGGLSSMAGASAQRSAQDAANAAQADIKNRLNNLTAPDIEQLKVYLQSPEVAGVISPELMTLTQAAPSAMETMSIDPRYQTAQQQALNQYNDIIAGGGLSAIDRANLEEMLRSTASQENSRQAQIQENMAKRGLGGSGATLAAEIASSQSAANQANENAMKLGAIALQRKMDTTGQMANLASQLRNTEFNEQANIATAKDRIAAMNAQFAYNKAAADAASKSAAKQFNVANAQQVENQRTDIKNRGALYNAGAYQTNFENQMRKAGLLNTASNTQTGLALEQGKQQGAMYGDIGSGIIKAGAALKDTDWKSLFGANKELPVPIGGINADRGTGFDPISGR